MVRKDPNKPKGRMSSYAFFVKYCREEVKDESVDFAEFSKSCSARWKVWTAWTISLLEFTIQNKYYIHTSA